MSRSVARRGPSYVLLVTLLVALAVGAAASLLIGAATSSGNPPLPRSELLVPAQAQTDIFVYAVLALGGFFLALWLFGLFRRGGFRLASTFGGLLPYVVVLLLLYAALALHPIPALWLGEPGHAVPAGNTTGVTPPPSSPQNNSTLVANATPPLLTGVPGWVPFVLLAGAVVVVAVYGVPIARGLIESRRERRRSPGADGPGTAEVREVLEAAAGELETGAEPRVVIIRLYGELLDRLGTAIGNVNPHTPEEIRTLHLERLGIRHEAATRLTRLFEEARYSSHAMGEASLSEVRSAIDAALSDLARTWGM